MKFKKKPFRKWLDALCSVVVKTRDLWRCQRCGKPVRGRQAQWCHINSRSSNAVRWHLSNSLLMCASCHGDAHARPSEFHEWFSDKYPARKDDISQMARQLFTWKEEDYRRTEKYLLSYARGYNVDYTDISKQYQKRLKRLLDEV